MLCGNGLSHHMKSFCFKCALVRGIEMGLRILTAKAPIQYLKVWKNWEVGCKVLQVLCPDCWP